MFSPKRASPYFPKLEVKNIIRGFPKIENNYAPNRRVYSVVL